MKILLAPDKFKGSLTAAEVAAHLGRGLAERGIAYRSLPLADGGDGSVSAAIHAGFTAVPVTVTGPTGRPRDSQFAEQGDTAVLEVADTCGLAALPDGIRAPITASSRGLGDAMQHALRRGARRVVLALGGSAGTDGGTGLLTALGMRFLDADGVPVDAGGGALAGIHTVDTAGMIDLDGVEIVVASDVENPLTGPLGAAAVYGPQKGADPGDIRALDAGLANLVERLAAAGYPDAHTLSRSPGAGAAGGIGFAGLILGATVVSGAAYFLGLLDFDAAVADCDLVITGEGRLDSQTQQGKLPVVVAKRAGDRPVIAVVGSSDVTPEELAAMGIGAVFALTDRTAENPREDAALSARLLYELGRSMPLAELLRQHRQQLPPLP